MIGGHQADVFSKEGGETEQTDTISLNVLSQKSHGNVYKSKPGQHLQGIASQNSCYMDKKSLI